MITNTVATIDFSAQFGGRDAAAAVLPHFKALKSASKGIVINSFPYPLLAFILRVDGEVNQFGFSGAGNLDIDIDGKYMSVDIGIKKEDRENIYAKIRTAVLDSLPIIDAALRKKGIDGVDANALRVSLESLCKRYAETEETSKNDDDKKPGGR